MLVRGFKLTAPSQCFIEGGGADPPAPSGGGGDGGGTGTPPAPAGVSQSEVDRIVKERVEGTRQATIKKISEELGVDLEQAKQIIADANAKAESEKSDAQKAKEAADRAREEADLEKAASAKDRHDTKVERALLKVAPTFEKDDDGKKLDAWVSRVSRLVNGDVEVGADSDAISAAIKTLKDDMPQLFGAGEKEEGGSLPPGDPKGTPKPKPGGEDAFKRGQERAKAAAAGSQYPILQVN